jgi:hypothetical protein
MRRSTRRPADSHTNNIHGRGLLVGIASRFGCPRTDYYSGLAICVVRSRMGASWYCLWYRSEMVTEGCGVG